MPILAFIVDGPCDLANKNDRNSKSSAENEVVSCKMLLPEYAKPQHMSKGQRRQRNEGPAALDSDLTNVSTHCGKEEDTC